MPSSPIGARSSTTSASPRFPEQQMHVYDKFAGLTIRTLPSSSHSPSHLFDNTKRTPDQPKKSPSKKNIERSHKHHASTWARIQQWFDPNPKPPKEATTSTYYSSAKSTPCFLKKSTTDTLETTHRESAQNNRTRPKTGTQTQGETDKYYDLLTQRFPGRKAALYEQRREALKKDKKDSSLVLKTTLKFHSISTIKTQK